jgi:hypothetical protein
MAAEGEAVGRMVAEAVVVRTEVAAGDIQAAVVDRTPVLTRVLRGVRRTAVDIGGIRFMAAAQRGKLAAQALEQARQTRTPTPVSQQETIPGKNRL